jgi:hypothetical protein
LSGQLEVGQPHRQTFNPESYEQLDGAALQAPRVSTNVQALQKQAVWNPTEVTRVLQNPVLLPELAAQLATNRIPAGEQK